MYVHTYVLYIRSGGGAHGQNTKLMEPNWKVPQLNRQRHQCFPPVTRDWPAAGTQEPDNRFEAAGVARAASSFCPALTGCGSNISIKSRPQSPRCGDPLPHHYRDPPHSSTPCPVRDLGLDLLADSAGALVQWNNLASHHQQPEMDPGSVKGDTRGLLSALTHGR